MKKIQTELTYLLKSNIANKTQLICSTKYDISMMSKLNVKTFSY